MGNQEFIANGGRIFRLCDPKTRGGRVITVAYKRVENEETGAREIHYGAAIFRPEPGEKVSFVRKPHNRTAIHRALNLTVVVPDIEGDDFNAFKNYMRKTLYRHGVDSDRVRE